MPHASAAHCSSRASVADSLPWKGTNFTPPPIPAGMDFSSTFTPPRHFGTASYGGLSFRGESRCTSISDVKDPISRIWQDVESVYSASRGKPSSAAVSSAREHRPGGAVNSRSRPFTAVIVADVSPSSRDGRRQPSSRGDPAMLPPAGGRIPSRMRTTRLYPNAPNQQSIVDQVVFGRDMDFSGEDQFDEEYTCMFTGSAGRASWEGFAENAGELRFAELPSPKSTIAYDEEASNETRPRRMGKMLVPDAPGQRSLVDQVVFNRDIDQSGDTHHSERYKRRFEGSAGQPSHFESPRGLRQIAEPGRDFVHAPRHMLPVNQRATTAPSYRLAGTPRRCRNGRPAGRLQKILSSALTGSGPVVLNIGALGEP